MSKQILTILKRELDNLTAYDDLNAETQRNKLKEVLQYYVLNFIYHHPQHSQWVMYGGSALRIIHEIDRMSVDLDFEVPHQVTEKFLENMKLELENYFQNTYGAGSDFLTTKVAGGRGLLLKFHIGKALNFGHPTGKVHVKIDLNHFVAPKTVIERRPINRDQLSFVIITYNMSALMASKIAAIFLRGTRHVGKAVYEEKGRDIYDLLWYMKQKVVPDFDYLASKEIDIADIRTLFDKLTIQMNKVNDENLKQDLTPLFTNRQFIKNWLKNWRESYFRLLDNYQIRTVTKLKQIRVHHDVIPDIFYFIYTYETEEGEPVNITCSMSDSWIKLKEGSLSIPEEKKISDMIEFASQGVTSLSPSEEKLKRYAGLFYCKIEEYLKKTNQVVLGDAITTKLIRMTANNLNPKEQIVLNKSVLLSCELDDLLK